MDSCLPKLNALIDIRKERVLDKEYDARSILKLSETGLNSAFFFS